MLPGREEDIILQGEIEEEKPSSRPSRNSPVDVDSIKLARLRAVEQAAPWKTRVSDLKSGFYKTSEEMAAIRNPTLHRFYTEQNDLLDFMEERYLMTEESGDTGTLKEEANTVATRFAINASFGLNVTLTILKVIALVISGSVAMLASTIDSFLDLLSGAVLFVTRRAIDRRDVYLYPQGKRRLEPVGVLVFATVMSVSALQIMREALQRVVDGVTGEPKIIEVDNTVVAVVCVTIGSKLFMYFFCHFIGQRTGSASVKAYATDHGNDVLSNLVGVGGMLAAARVPSVWYMDPIAAIMISAFILFNWIGTGMLHVDQVVGKSANGQLLKKLIFLALNHDENVIAVDTTRAYHFGENLLVETDIVLPAKMGLATAHDIGESLQIKIEGLEDVERCFVHLDTDFNHKPEHKIR